MTAVTRGITRRTVFLVAFLLFVLSIIPLLALSLFTWIATGHNLDAQLDWYIDQGEKLQAWGTGVSRDAYPWE